MTPLQAAGKPKRVEQAPPRLVGHSTASNGSRHPQGKPQPPEENVNGRNTTPRRPSTRQRTRREGVHPHPGPKRRRIYEKTAAGNVGCIPSVSPGLQTSTAARRRLTQNTPPKPDCQMEEGSEAQHESTQIGTDHDDARLVTRRLKTKNAADQHKDAQERTSS